MSVFRKIKEQGLSLKVTSTLLLIVSIGITSVLIFSSARAFVNFKALEKSTDEYISLEEEASKLMDASDYLTEQVQCYTVMGDRKYLDNYFEEAFVTRRREKAINAMEAVLPDSLALYELNDSMRHSEMLMSREYYAMKLVLEAQGDSDIPEPLKTVILTEDDASLNSAEKMNLAKSMVHDTEYYLQKSEIRRNLNECLKALKDSTFNSQQGMENTAKRALISLMVLIIIQTALIISMIWLYTHLGIRPVLKAVDHIKKDESIPLIGASEFRYLAGAYNVMYNAYRSSISHLNYKASHDELTGTYNRAGYEIIKGSVDMTSSALMIIDCDKFKQINDSYGHETGDKVLKKVAAALIKHYRSEDYVCRVGGDEFLVLMVHLNAVNYDPRELIERKMHMINEELSDVSDGVPKISLSAGVSFDSKCVDPDEMFRRADTALYHVKENGRNGCSFYSDELKDLVSLKKTSISQTDDISIRVED